MQFLNIKNPVILGQKNDLPLIEKFHFMKSVMKQNQTTQFTSINKAENVTSLIKSKKSGIMLEEDFKVFLAEKNYNVVKMPWVIIGSRSDNYYSRIDEPLYFVDNGTLWEQYQFKSVKNVNALATVLEGYQLEWKADVENNLYERRSNLGNVTLLAMVEFESTNLFLLQEDLLKRKVSSVIPNTYEVRNF